MKSYVGIDGDKVGARIETLIILENLKGVADLSQKVRLAIEKTKSTIVSLGGKVIFAEGDSILAETEIGFSKQQCENLVRIFYDTTGCTASAGIGRTPLEAYLALKLAKCSARQRVVDYQEVSQNGESGRVYRVSEDIPGHLTPDT